MCVCVVRDILLSTALKIKEESIILLEGRRTSWDAASSRVVYVGGHLEFGLTLLCFSVFSRGKSVVPE